MTSSLLLKIECLIRKRSTMTVILPWCTTFTTTDCAYIDNWGENEMYPSIQSYAELVISFENHNFFSIKNIVMYPSICQIRQFRLDS